AWMTQTTPEFSETAVDPRVAAAALGLDADDVVADVPVQAVSCGVPFLFVPLRTRDAIDRARVNADAVQDLLRRSPSTAHGVFLFPPEGGTDDATVYSRMFAPALGIAEDPATGIASGPLGCYLIRHRLVAAEKAAAMLSLQGVRMGRPSHVHISLDVDDGAIRAVRV